MCSVGDGSLTLDQRSQAVDGFSEVHGLGVEIDFFDFGIGSHHGGGAPERNREHSIRDQLSALNVGFMERLLLIWGIIVSLEWGVNN
jgi:hypothetical protein